MVSQDSIQNVLISPEDLVRLYGSEIVNNIREIPYEDTTATRSEIHKLYDKESGKYYFVKILGARSEHTAQHIPATESGLLSSIKILDPIIAPWFVSPPAIQSLEYGQSVAAHQDILKKYLNLDIPDTRICSIKLDDGTYRHVALQEGAKGKILRSQFPDTAGVMGESAFENSMYDQLAKSHPDAIKNLKLFLTDLVDLFNSHHFLPDLNFGVLSTDNILYDVQMGKFSLVDIDDFFELPTVFTQQLSPNELLISRDGRINEKLLKFIDENSQYTEPYLGRIRDWLNSLCNILSRE